VPQARSEVARSAAEALAAANRIGFPCVLKPTDRQGQVGLSVAESAAEVAASYATAGSEARGGAVLVEELVPGREVTVNAFSTAGRFTALTATDRITAEPPAFGVALAHAWPSRLPVQDVRTAVEAARAAVQALGIEEGPSYTQVLAAPDGPRVVEVAARLGGGHDAELCHAALGIDLNALALAAALGEATSNAVLRVVPKVGGVCVRFLVAQEGELIETRGEEEARGVEGVLDVLLYRSPGYRFGPLRRGSDRAGAILAVGDSQPDALARADRAAEHIRFETAETLDEAVL
jgi:biotin carboxylase